MDEQRFDRLATAVADGTSRRRVLRGLSASLLGGAAALIGGRVRETRAAGQAGPTQIISRYQQCSVPVGSVEASCTATCFVGSEVATGGGFSTTPNASADFDVRTNAPRPSDNGAVPTGWEVRFVNRSNLQLNVNIYVLCAPLG